MDRIREFFELERFELREVIYESFLRKFDGDFDFVRIRESQLYKTFIIHLVAEIMKHNYKNLIFTIRLM